MLPKPCNTDPKKNFKLKTMPKITKNILVKASGDVINSRQVHNFIIKKAKNNYLVIIPGAGTKISRAFEKAGYKIKFDSCGRRLTHTLKERDIMRDILEHEEKTLQDKFAGTGVIIHAPILYAGSVLCPINGDDLAKAWHLGFDEIYVFTTKKRTIAKKKIFADFPQVKIIGV
jgi:acetylglutamate kinase